MKKTIKYIVVMIIVIIGLVLIVNALLHPNTFTL